MENAVVFTELCNGSNVARILHHADEILFSLAVGTDRADLGIGDVLADFAAHDLLLGSQDRL